MGLLQPLLPSTSHYFYMFLWGNALISDVLGVQEPEFSSNSGTLDIFNNWVDFFFEKLVGVRLFIVIYLAHSRRPGKPLELVLRIEEDTTRKKKAL
jgi:hypothetical protein